MIKKNFVRGVAALTLGATLFVSACRENGLVVGNPNQPDVALAYRNAINVEAVISKLFQQMFNGHYAVAGDNIWTQALVMAFESSSGLGNFGMGTRSSIPRPLIDNSIGNGQAAGNFRDFDVLTRNVRQAANAIAALDAFIAEGAGTGSQARDSRARSFAYFALGYGLGQLSLIYDSASVILPWQIPAEGEFAPLSHSSVVNAAAIQALDSAFAIANAPAATTGGGGWPLPKEWFLSASTAFGAPATGPPIGPWRQIVRSYRAKFRAGVARTPEERALVNWNLVVEDATNGITADLEVLSDQLAGWFQTTLNQLAVSASWSQMTPFILGMADTTSLYQTWLRTAVNSRSWGTTPLRTPDQRFPSGETRAAQNTASGGSARTGTPPGTVLYYRNRPSGEDASNWAWGIWQYDNHRFWIIRAAGGNGPFTLMSKTEVDMLAAEGYIRLGQTSQAIPLINLTRVRAGLPAIDPTNDHNTPVPGGSACVPRVPLGDTDPVVVTCGNVWEAMKWEKRLETAFTGFAQWFIDARGWGDLYAGTPLEWPVPYQELFARDRDTYQITRVATARTNPLGSLLGTYGFGRNDPIY